MSSIVSPPNDNSIRLLGLFEELLRGLPSGTATLESQRTKHNDGTIIRLKPSNKRAAPFGAHTDDGNLSNIDAFFGSGTTFEIENSDVVAMLEEVRRLALAVIAGKCEQRFGLLGVRGAIRVETENTYRCTDYFHLRLFPKTVRYEPYCPGATKSEPAFPAPSL